MNIYDDIELIPKNLWEGFPMQKIKDLQLHNCQQDI
jgi:hypothetical protein